MIPVPSPEALPTRSYTEAIEHVTKNWLLASTFVWALAGIIHSQPLYLIGSAGAILGSLLYRGLLRQRRDFPNEQLFSMASLATVPLVLVFCFAAIFSAFPHGG